MNLQEKKYSISENFLKDFLKDFYHRILSVNYMDDLENFEMKTIRWLRFIEKFQCIKLQTIILLLEGHQKNELWFSGLIGFFYQHGIGGCIINQNKALESYLLAINNENEKDSNNHD